MKTQRRLDALRSSSSFNSANCFSSSSIFFACESQSAYANHEEKHSCLGSRYDNTHKSSKCSVYSAFMWTWKDMLIISLQGPSTTKWHKRSLRCYTSFRSLGFENFRGSLDIFRKLQRTAKAHVILRKEVWTMLCSIYAESTDRFNDIFSANPARKPRAPLMHRERCADMTLNLCRFWLPTEGCSNSNSIRQSALY